MKIPAETIRNRVETFKGEGLKTAAEVTLGGLAKSALGEKLIETYAFGLDGRIVDEALHTVVAGMEFENPVLFGAGWDESGRAALGLYALGFAGGEVGTVTPMPQPGNKKPRLWTINPSHSVAINRMGFNSPGMNAVNRTLENLGELPFTLGVNIGRNKNTSNELAPVDFGAAIYRLYPRADFFVLGISSVNTEGVRDLQNKELLRESIQYAYSAMEEYQSGRKPLFIKIDGERSESELNDIIEVAVEERASGVVAINSYGGKDFKAKYGKRWANQEGGAEWR